MTFCYLFCEHFIVVFNVYEMVTLFIFIMLKTIPALINVCTMFDFRFLDKMYLLSSASALEKFMKNPRPYLLPPLPRPPCKMVICGPPYSGKTELSYRLANLFSEAQVWCITYIKHALLFYVNLI